MLTFIHHPRVKNWAAFILPLIVLSIFYGEVLIAPASYMFNADGDGIKNYFSVAWYLEHNESWMQFEGMNHPQGDLLTFADAQPALSWFLRIFGVGGIGGVGVMNFLMLMSIPFASWVVYRIFLRLDRNSWWAVLMACFIALLSPQLERMPGHYSLSYIFMLPLCVLHVIKLRQNNSWRSALGIAILIMITMLVHPYLALMMGMFVGLSCATLWFSRELRFAKDHLKWWVAAAVPIVLIQLWISTLDSVTDRPSDPWGFWVFDGDLRSVFLPQYGWIRDLLSDRVSYSGIEWETIAFVGTPALLLLILWPILVLSRQIGKLHAQNAYLLLPGVLMLIFSFGVPFHWFPDFTESLTFLKNFRVLGRFSWPFVVVLNVLIFASLRKGDKYQGIVKVFLIVAFVAGLGELIPRHEALSTRITSQSNVFGEQSEYTNLHDRADAILPIPYFYVGSEVLMKSAEPDALREAFKASYASGLPLLSTQMSRSSYAECRDHLALISPAQYPKALDSLLSEESWLVIANSELSSSIEQELIKDLGMQAEEWDWKVVSAQEILKQDQSYDPNDFQLSESLIDSVFFTNKLNNMLLKDQYHELFNFKSGEIPSGNYSFSIWYKNPSRMRTETAIILESRDKNGATAWDVYETLDRTFIFSGDSIRFEITMPNIDAEKAYRVLAKQPDRERKEVTVSSVALVQENVEVQEVDGQKVSLNNHAFVPLIALPDTSLVIGATSHTGDSLTFTPCD